MATVALVGTSQTTNVETAIHVRSLVKSRGGRVVTNAGRRAKIATRTETATETGATDTGTETGASVTILGRENATRSASGTVTGTEETVTGSESENGIVTETVTATVEMRRTVSATAERRGTARDAVPRLFQSTPRPTTADCPTDLRPVATEVKIPLASADGPAMKRYVS